MSLPPPCICPLQLPCTSRIFLTPDFQSCQTGHCGLLILLPATLDTALPSSLNRSPETRAASALALRSSQLQRHLWGVWLCWSPLQLRAVSLLHPDVYTAGCLTHHTDIIHCDISSASGKEMHLETLAAQKKPKEPSGSLRTGAHLLASFSRALYSYLSFPTCRARRWLETVSRLPPQGGRKWA